MTDATGEMELKGEDRNRKVVLPRPPGGSKKADPQIWDPSY